MHKKINLNFDWYFSDNFTDSHLTDYNNMQDFSLVNIPHTIVTTPYNNFDEKEFFKICCYKKEIKVKKEYEGKDLTLVFGGVGHKATIYVNDDFVVIHSGGYDEFKVNISEYVRYGVNNVITVVVDANENSNIPPFGSFLDNLCYGGIYREVYLEVTEKEKIEDYFIYTKDVNNSITAYCEIDITHTPVEIVLTVFDKEKTICVNRYNVNREHEVLDFDVKNKENWTSDNPKLYNVNIKMFQEKKLLDEVNGRFGFREIELKEDGLYLNSERIKLIGLNRHGSYPYVGYAMPKSVEYKDAEILKNELGVNIVRSAHAPFSRHFLEACDELGLLVIQEIPGWNYTGNEEFQKNTRQNLKSIIKRDKNHPSIIMWGVRVSGAPDNFKLFSETNEIAQGLDKTRLTFGAKSVRTSDNIEDVYGYNYYLERGKKPKTIKGKQILISEHTGHIVPAKIYDDEAQSLKQALNHLKFIDYANSCDDILGAIGYSMTDYNTHANFGSSDKVCYCGVLDMFRNPKCASKAYASQSDNNIVLNVTSSSVRGDYKNLNTNEMYIFSNCEYVKMFKNDTFVETFYPNYKDYPHLIHPPIVVDDSIGQVLERQEKMSAKDSETLKKIMKRILQNEYKMTFLDNLIVFRIFHKYKKPQNYLHELFQKYVIGEVNQDVVLRFDGYTNENVVKSVTISDTKKVNLSLEIDKEKLEINETFDATRVTIKAEDQNGNLARYSNQGLRVNVEGGIELIGPCDLSINGGYASFWIKTNQKGNYGTIKVTSNGQELTKEIEIIIK